MTTPTTPGEAIRVAAQRHATSAETARTLAAEIAEKRQTSSEGTASEPAPDRP